MPRMNKVRSLAPLSRRGTIAPSRTIAERLDLFVRRGAELEVHPLLTQPTRIGLTLRGGSGPMTATVEEPDDTALSSLLLKLRPFLLQQEDGYLPEVLNLARRTIDDPELVHAIESGRSGYERAGAGAGFNVVIDGHQMTPKSAAELYLYSRYYHSHRQRERELEAIVGPAASLTRYLFLDYVAEVTKVIVWTTSVIVEARTRGLLSDVRLPEDRHRAHPHLPQPPAVIEPGTRPQPIVLLDEESRALYDFALACRTPPAN